MRILKVLFFITLSLSFAKPMQVCGQASKKAVVKYSIDGIRISGIDNPDLRAFDQMMTTFMREHKVPGASLAVSRNGDLVYARGFGHSDREKLKSVLPSTQFRIASISKPITATAIISLVHKGKIKLDDKYISYLPKKERSKVHPQIKNVTIRHLLQHRGGWDRGISGDPMFKTVSIGNKLGLKEPANQKQIIKYMLTQPLDFEPGTRYAYSNFGYCLLGRVIETTSKKNYDQYVKKSIFAPLKIKSTILGRTLKQAKNETRYHTPKPDMVSGIVPGAMNKKVPRQYGGWCLENMDSHGGWIATASDLVKFADAFNTKKLDFLTEDLIAEIFNFAPQDKSKNVYYGFGWQVRKFPRSKRINTWHSGALTGTSTILVRRHDGLNWAVLFNARNGKNKKGLSSLIDPLVHKAANKVKKWPQKSIKEN